MEYCLLCLAHSIPTVPDGDINSTQLSCRWTLFLFPQSSLLLCFRRRLLSCLIGSDDPCSAHPDADVTDDYEDTFQLD